MKVNREMLWQTLEEKAYVKGAMPETVTLESPWYVRLLVGIGGWLAALFVLGFIISGFMIVFRNETLGTVIGIAMVIGSYLMLRSLRDNDFAEQFALAVSFAGQVVFAFGLFKLLRGDNALPYLILALFQAALAWLMPSSVHRSWSAFAGAIALSFSLRYYHVLFVDMGILLAIVALIWIQEFRWLQHRRILAPVGYGLTLALIFLQAIGSHYQYYFFRMMSRMYVMEKFWFKPWMGELLCGVVALLVVWKILQRYQRPLTDRTSLLALLLTVLVVAASFQASGITVGLVILLLGFANGNRILTGLGILAMLYFISAYYYLLNTTLLQKSTTLLVLGVLMLIAGWIVQRFYSRQGGEA